MTYIIRVQLHCESQTGMLLHRGKFLPQEYIAWQILSNLPSQVGVENLALPLHMLSVMYITCKLSWLPTWRSPNVSLVMLVSSLLKRGDCIKVVISYGRHWHKTIGYMMMEHDPFLPVSLNSDDIMTLVYTPRWPALKLCRWPALDPCMCWPILACHRHVFVLATTCVNVADKNRICPYNLVWAKLKLIST